MMHLELSNGLCALVDNEDHAKLSEHRWHATVPRHTTYAYRTIRVDGRNKSVSLHREIMCAPAGFDVDHINGDGLDNRRENLRICTRSENIRNQTRKSSGKTSRFKGVCWDKQHSKWDARIWVNGRNRFLGHFASEEAAQIAYASAARELFGEFAAPLVSFGSSEGGGK